MIRKSDWKTSLILLSTPLILAVYLYHGMHPAFEKYFPLLKSNVFFEIYSYTYEYFAALILLFILPVFITRFILRENLRDYGLGLGDWKYGLRFVILSIIIVFPILLLGSHASDIRATYPHVRNVTNKPDLFMLVEFCYMFYYIGWEFFFRGYILFGLREKFGDFYAILIQTVPSSIMHIGKPEGEFIGAIIVGIIFGYLVLRTKSIWYAFFIHLFIGIAIDILVVIQFH